MTRLVNNFDGGPDGADLTLANSDQVPVNNAFDEITVAGGSNRILKYKDAAGLGRATAEYVLRCGNTTPDDSAGMLWDSSMGTQTQIWWREYLYLTALPTATALDSVSVFECDNLVVFACWVTILKTSGLFRIGNGPGMPDTSSQTAVSAAAVPVGAWIRLEGRLKCSTGSVGEIELQIYATDPDSDTPDETLLLTGINTGTSSAKTYAYGYLLADSHQPDMYISGLELNNTGWPGPAPFKSKGVPGILTNPIAVHSNTR